MQPVMRFSRCHARQRAHASAAAASFGRLRLRPQGRWRHQAAHRRRTSSAVNKGSVGGQEWESEPASAQQPAPAPPTPPTAPSARREHSGANTVPEALWVPWGWKTTLAGWFLFHAFVLPLSIEAGTWVMLFFAASSNTVIPIREVWQLSRVLSSALVLLPASWLLNKCYDVRQRGLFPLSLTHWHRWLGLLVAGTCLNMVHFAWDIMQPGTYNPVLGDWVSKSMLAMSVVVLAPNQEELVYRGFLLQSLCKFLPSWAAAVLSSIAFAVAHNPPKDSLGLQFVVKMFSMPGFSNHLFNSLLWSWAYVLTKNLWPPIVLHAQWNLACFLGKSMGLGASIVT